MDGGSGNGDPLSPLLEGHPSAREAETSTFCGQCCKLIKGWLVLQLLKCVFPVGRPRAPFKDLTPPPAPDYNEASWWAAYPGQPSDAETTPASVAAVPDAERPAACFFVHPTGYFGAEHWNEPRPCQQSEMLTDSFMHTDASAFNGCCRIYAPRYRQASVAAQLFDKQSGQLALELAYSDVKEALLHFLEEEPTAPVILASHSQGGQHLMRILAECVEPDEALQQRLVAAYMIGTNMLPQDMFVRSFPSLHPSDGPCDAPRAVISWDTKAGPEATNPPDPDFISEFPGFWYPSGWETPEYGAAMLNTNPLTWRSSDLGMRATEGWLGAACVKLADGVKPFSTKAFFTGQLTSAQCKPVLEQGGYRPADLEFYAESLPHCLRVPHLSTEDRGAFGLFTDDGDYHLLDYPLFYYNIRQNVSDRLEAFLSQSDP